MHRDFNAERSALERVSFTFGTGPDGQPAQFVARTEVRPESILAYEQITEDADAAAAMPVIDSLIKAIIVPENGDLWDYVRGPDNPDSIGLGSINTLAAWLVEQVVARPTVTPSASPHGSTSPATGTTSTAPSPLPAGVASAG